MYCEFQIIELILYLQTAAAGKNSGTADMGLVPQPADNAHEFRVAADMPLHEMIQPERGQKAHADDRIQLNGD